MIKSTAQGRHRLLAVGAMIVLCAGLLVASLSLRGANGIALQTEHVGRRRLVSVVAASGEIRPRRYVDVGSEISGRVVELLVKEGERVRLRQPLCRIDATRFAASTRQSEAGLSAGMAELARARSEAREARLGYERVRTLHAAKVASQEDLDRTEAQAQAKAASVRALERRTQQLQAALESDRDALDKTTVVAPIEGIVTLIQRQQGEMVIGAQSFAPTVVMTISDLTAMDAQILVDQNDVRKLGLGQAATVEVDAVPELALPGKVTAIGASAIPRGAIPLPGAVAGQARDFKVTVALDQVSSEVRPGMTVTAEITTAVRERALAVPLQAIVTRVLGSDGRVIDPVDGTATSAPRRSDERADEEEGVFVLDHRTAVFRRVKTGVMGRTHMEILDGLREGDEIAIGPYGALRTLSDGAAVRRAPAPATDP